MPKPTDRPETELSLADLLAEAERIAANQYKNGRYLASTVLRELCRRLASAQAGAQGAVGEVIVYDSYRGARLFDAENCWLPEGTKLHAHPPAASEDVADAKRWRVLRNAYGHMKTSECDNFLRSIGVEPNYAYVVSLDDAIDTLPLRKDARHG